MRDPNPPPPATSFEELIGTDACLEIMQRHGLIPPLTDEDKELLAEIRRREFTGPVWA